MLALRLLAWALAAAAAPGRTWGQADEVLSLLQQSPPPENGTNESFSPSPTPSPTPAPAEPPNCTVRDRKLIWQADLTGGRAEDGIMFLNWPHLMTLCEKRSRVLSRYGFWVSPTKFEHCVNNFWPGLTYSCLECFIIQAEWSIHNCQLPCLTADCTQRCIHCVNASYPQVTACAGGPLPEPKPCGENIHVQRDG
mmetsp:Transcript_20699/g.59962  ORF Transcript_20699/g.59962 Transcript_20699/m.59962 type:complete len:195 (-) Transcript_20699:2-586(-)